MMGMLYVMRYPTPLAVNTADHTYVECGSGVGWGCWGGKTGGTLLAHASGSTRRADQIARPDEKAGIQCYAVNGVCHQAANRILLPAGITADGARGYTLSNMLFGPYGRQSAALGLCKAPLLLHSGTVGDLPYCMTQPSSSYLPPLPMHAWPTDSQDRHYMDVVLGIYSAYADGEPNQASVFEFQMVLFKALIDHRIRISDTSLDDRKYARVLAAREVLEQNRINAEEALFARGQGAAFCREFDQLTVRFQNDLAKVLDKREYLALLALDPMEPIVVSDPDVVRAAYEPLSRPPRSGP